jgi:hypothetical protein
MPLHPKYPDGTPIKHGDAVTFDDFDIGSETPYRNEGFIYFDDGEWYIPEANTAEFPDIWKTIEKKEQTK